MLSEAILLKYGAIKKEYKKGEFLFLKGESARYYFQIISGEIKMNNYNNNGREFIQGIFGANSSFGEPPLFIEEVYPANAEVSQNVAVYLLLKEDFLTLIRETEDASIGLLQTFSKRLFYKAVIAAEMSTENAEHRIVSLLDYFKKHTSKEVTEEGFYKLDITRQEIANLTGLRVETVIRAVKNLEKKEKIYIKKRKIYI